VLRRKLERRGLRVFESWSSTYFTVCDMAERTVEDFRASMSFIKRMDGTSVVVAELGGAVHQHPVPPAYVTFLVMQTLRYKAQVAEAEEAESATLAETRRAWDGRTATWAAGLLLLALLPIPLLADHLDTVLEVAIHEFGMPHAVAGVVIAALVLSPEGAAAIQAAYANRLQRSVNLMLGSALSSVALAVRS
jgi:hypothetical protein